MTSSSEASVPEGELAEVTATATYMYAVSRGLLPGDLEQVRGMDEQPLRLVAHEDLVAVVSTVTLAAFGEDALRRNLEDLGWLARTARLHDSVVQTASVSAPTAPMRLATVFHDDDAVRRRLREWHAELSRVLDRVDGCGEWSVKVLAPAASNEPGDGSAERPVSGAEYLRRKKAQNLQRLEADARATETARLVHERLAEASRASQQMPAQDPRLSGHQGAMVLNAAYLVPDQRAADFAELVASLVAEHSEVAIDSRGPWPPYSFAMLDNR
jgi:hypothetical protein